MNQAWDHDLQLGKWIGSAALGALVMYMLDPERGAPRRAQSGEKLRQIGRDTGQAFEKIVQDISHRVGAAEVFNPGERAAHAVRHASAASSAASDTGALPGGAATADMSASGTSATGSPMTGMSSGGVSASGTSVGGASPSHSSASGASPRDSATGGASASGASPGGTFTGGSLASRTSILGMQGIAERLSGTGRGIAEIAHGLRAHSWDPKLRNAAMLGGGALGLLGLALRRSPLGLAAGVAGALILARGAVNRPLTSLIGAGGRSGRVDIEKTVHIDAPPEQVYDLLASYDNFPRFMANVAEVRDLGERRSHWVVKGPAGQQVEWDAMLTEQSRPHRLAWRSVPGSEVEHSGELRFEAVRGGTRATVQLSFAPAAGAAGQAIASLLGHDPKRQLAAALGRMKSLVERGAAPHAPSRGDSAGSQFLH